MNLANNLSVLKLNCQNYSETNNVLSLDEVKFQLEVDLCAGKPWDAGICTTSHSLS